MLQRDRETEKRGSHFVLAKPKNAILEGKNISQEILFLRMVRKKEHISTSNNSVSNKGLLMPEKNVQTVLN